jgi:hypothetical protein
VNDEKYCGKVTTLTALKETRRANIESTLVVIVVLRSYVFYFLELVKWLMIWVIDQ